MFSSRNCYKFGPFLLDPSLPMLFRDGEPVPLPPKALETLVALVEQSGHVVKREQLIEIVWPDTVVEENNLSVNISQLRKALGDREDGEKYIETVPRRGYRFTAPVGCSPLEGTEPVQALQRLSPFPIPKSIETDTKQVTTATNSVPDETPHAWNSRAIVTNSASVSSQLRRFTLWPGILIVIVTVAVIVAGASLIRLAGENGRGSPSEQRVAAPDRVNGATVRSLAVLPFSGEDSDDFGASTTSADGELTNAVVVRLAEAGNVNITPQSAVLAEKMTRNNILLTGHRLNADAVLSGVVYRNDAEWISLRLHLVSVNGGEVLWANTFTQPRAQTQRLLDQIVGNVLAGLHRLKDREEYESRARRYTANREAYQHYLQGRFLWDQRHDVFAPDHLGWLKDNIASVNQLEEAQRLDPNFALPYVGLADIYKADDYSSQERRRAEEYALRAIALDPGLAEAHATLGFIRMLHYWDWTGAEAEFKRALEINPDCVTAHQWYALFHALRGNASESIKEITRAREMAPYSLSILIDAAEMQYYATGVVPQMVFSDTIIPFLRVLELQPKALNARGLLTQVYWIIGEYDRAVAVADSDWKGRPQDYARHKAGARKGTREFDDIPGAHTYQRAVWHAQLNQREEALDLLERAHRYHHFFIIYIKAEPFFKNLHDEPRYQELLRAVGLAP